MLMYMDMALRRDEDEAEKKKAEHFINYLIALYTAPSFGQKRDSKFEQGRKELLESITPKPKVEGPAKVYQWDYEKLKRIKNQQ